MISYCCPCYRTHFVLNVAVVPYGILYIDYGFFISSVKASFAPTLREGVMYEALKKRNFDVEVEHVEEETKINW